MRLFYTAILQKYLHQSPYSGSYFDLHLPFIQNPAKQAIACNSSCVWCDDQENLSDGDNCFFRDRNKRMWRHTHVMALMRRKEENCWVDGDSMPVLFIQNINVGEGRKKNTDVKGVID